MAQQVVIAGAMFEDVPQISVPDANNVYHPFLDTTIASNAAAASDIAQGKLAYVNGSLVTGTNQGGGGGGAVKMGALRPDAELVQTWSYDKKIHADEGVTIPNYTTSEQTLKSSSNLVSGKELDCTQYDYIVTQRGIATPIYSSATNGTGKTEYFVYSYAFEIVCQKPDYFSVSSKQSDRYVYKTSIYPTSGTIVYWTSASNLRAAASTTNGVFLTVSDPSLSTSSATTNGKPTLTVKSPDLKIRGGSTYINSTYWGYLTDVRYQYVIELWKVPRTGNIVGFTQNSMAYHAIQCAQSASGTLT